MGAFCQGDLALTNATARADAVAGPQSAAFDALMSQLTFALFPSENPHLRPDSDDSDVVPLAGS